MHPSYPVRPLHKEWRAGYARKGRRLMVLLGVVLVAWIVGAWWAIDWVVTHVLPQ